MNRWLNSTVKAYTDKYGKTAKPVVYDVGSRDGHDGVELATRITSGTNLRKDSTIVLFECNPPQIKAIRSRYPDAILIEEAISNKKGKAAFLQLNGDKNVIGSSSMDLNRSKMPWAKDNNTIEVKTRRLDDVIKQLGHQKTEIDIMKIDIEGYTWEALESLGTYLRNVRVFHIETEIEGVARNKTNLDIALFMQNQGYLCNSIEYEWPPSIQDQVWSRCA